MQDDDNMLLIENLITDSIITDANAVLVIISFELYTAVWTRCFLEG